MSDILNAINRANEKKFKAVVDHTGSCDGEHYRAGEPTELSESVIKALGSQVKVLEEVQPVQASAQETPPAPVETPKPEEPETKEVPQPPVNKMIGKEDAETK
jgi:hypothetical protein